MKQEPDPLILQKQINFEEIYNSDLEILTEEMLEFLETNDVPIEWLISIMKELYLCSNE
jgi:hypothetical protein